MHSACPGLHAGQRAGCYAQAAQMEACKGSLRELLELQADVKAYARGLAELSTSYKPSLDETDFAAELDNRAARAHRSMRCAA